MRNFKKKNKVLILGKGKIGTAVFYYLKKFHLAKEVKFFKKESEVKKFDILIGALPENFSKIALKLSLKYKKDLIDISTLPINFYLKHKKEINDKGIKVFPGCGFSPGLINLLVGSEVQNFDKISKIEISAGTLPQNPKLLFPFTWSFEEILETHLSSALIIKNGKKIKLPPFSGYRKEKNFESYFIEEYNSLEYTIRPKNLFFRAIRPVGFFYFFQYLKNYGFLDKKNISFCKKILTSKKEDNLSIAHIEILGKTKDKKKRVFFKILSFSKKREKLNSMQKITAIIPLIIFKFISQNKIKKEGIIFLEEIGKEKRLFKEFLKELKKEKSIKLLRKTR